MKVANYLVVSVYAVGFACRALPAVAATITQAQSVSITSQTITAVPAAVAPATFSNFDPSLGTLTALTFSFSGTATLSGNNQFNQLVIIGFLDETPGHFGLGGTGTGNRSFATPGETSIAISELVGASELPSFTIPGSTLIDSQFVSPGGSPVTLSNASLTDTLTYTYTPIPEPTSLALFGVGALNLIRRRRRSPTAR